MIRLLVLLLFVVFSLPVVGQTVVTVSGTVEDVNGNPVEEALVALIYEWDHQEDIVFSQSDGGYSLSITVSAGDPQGCAQLVMFDCDGYFYFEDICFTAEETDFSIDLLYCADGSEGCDVFLLIDAQPDSLWTLTAAGSGVGPYTYAWSDGSTDRTLSIDVSIPVEYCVTITDSQGCIAEDCIDFSPPSSCFVNIFEEPTFGGSYLFAEGYGQTDSLAYQWSTGEEGPSIFIDSSGEYCVTVTDGLGCESAECLYFEVDTSGLDVCFSYIFEEYGSSDSTTKLIVESFGVGPFTYQWSSGEATQAIDVVDEGTYCVEVTDSEGCVYETCYDFLLWEECGVWIACDPVPGGVHLVAFAFGADPISYLWSTGDETEEFIALESGEYCVTIVDGSGCTSDFCVDVEVEEVSECFTLIDQGYLDDGSVLLSIDIATDEVYDILWSTGETSDTISVMETGTYCVEVTGQESGCSFSTCTFVWIDNVDPACVGVLDVEHSDTSQAVLSVGFVFTDIPVDPNAYEYLWSTGESTSEITVEESGDYCVTVTAIDAADCTFEVCGTVIFEDNPFESTLFVAYYDAETELGLAADVEIYTVLPSGELELYPATVQSDALGIEGLFQVDNVEDGTYVALAMPALEDQYVPSYHIESMFWDEADLFVFDSESDDVQVMEIYAIPLTSLSGAGSIGGSATDDQLVAHAGDDDSRSEGPLAGVNIMLTHQGIPVEQEYTDQSGEYRFDNLPFGTYTVTLERPGHTRQQKQVTISSSNPAVLDVLFESGGPTSTEDLNSIDVDIFPNPTSERLQVKIPVSRKQKVQIVISDVNGRTMIDQQQVLSPSDRAAEVDVQMLNSGIYTIAIRAEDGRVTEKFIKI